MTSQKVKERLEKEMKVLGIFEGIFNETNAPITVKSFIEYSGDMLGEIYSTNMISPVISRMCKEGKIQRVYLQKGRTNSYLFVPLSFQIPHENRNWETKEEYYNRRISFLQSIGELNSETVQFYLDMIAAVESKNSRFVKRMPLYKVIESKDENYERFVTTISPFLPYLEQREAHIISQRLGISEKGPNNFKDIAQSMQLGYSQCIEIFSIGLYHIKRLMFDKLKVDQYNANAKNYF